MNKLNVKYDVLCIGMMVADIVVQAVNSFNFTEDTTYVENIGLTNGGDALNTAVILSKLGVRVNFVGKIGNDSFGKLLLDRVKSTGINVQGITISSGDSTGSAIVLINKRGNRVFVYNPGANNNLSYEDIDKKLFSKAKIIHIGAANVLPSLPNEDLENIYKIAKQNNCITSMDVTWDSTGRWIKAISAALPYVDYFMPSIEEAKFLANKNSIRECAEFFINAGVKNVILKLGTDGCYVRSEKEVFRTEAFEVDNVVDTTGAGDNFIAGFLTALTQGLPLKDCSSFACAVSAICVQEAGATAAVKNFEQIINFLSCRDVKWKNQL